MIQEELSIINGIFKMKHPKNYCQCRKIKDKRAKNCRSCANLGKNNPNFIHGNSFKLEGIKKWLEDGTSDEGKHKPEWLKQHADLVHISEVLSDYLLGRIAEVASEQVDLIERTAQCIAHRACCGSEHNPAEGKLHGYCVVCGVPWPCEYVGKIGQGEMSREEIVKVIGEHLRNVPIAGDWDRTRAIYLNEKVIEGLADALLQAKRDEG